MNEATNSLLADAASSGDSNKVKMIAAGGVLGAIAASTCCIVPLVLFSLGVSGAWIGQLTTLSAYQPIFTTITLVFLGCGFWMVYRKPEVACDEGEACAHPLPNMVVKLALWFATALILLAFAWPYVVPLILG